jgi:5-(carboxyamino)imidazole ribonucleotide mutase
MAKIVSIKDKRNAPLFPSMTGQRIVIILGSESDISLLKPIRELLEEFRIKSESRIASAHKEPERLIQMLEEYERLKESIIYITVAGRSNALSGFVDFRTRHPVIACPPQTESFWQVDLFSSLRMPKGVAPLVISDPENAALAACKILGEGNPDLAAKIKEYQRKLQQRNEKADLEARRTYG